MRAADMQSLHGKQLRWLNRLQRANTANVFSKIRRISNGFSADFVSSKN